MKKVKAFLQSKMAKVVSVAGAVVTSLAVSASAADADVVSAVTTGVNGIKTDIVSIAVIAIPVALGITALFFGVRKGMAFFKSIAK